MAGRSETRNMSDSHYGRVAVTLKKRTSTPELRKIYFDEENRHKRKTKQTKKKKDRPLWQKILLFWR